MRKICQGGVILLATSMVLCPAAALRSQTPASLVIDGRVLETGTERPVVGVKVMTDGAGIESTTDSDGHFQLTGVPAGPQRILTEKTGYAPAKPDGRKTLGNSGVWLTPSPEKGLQNVVIHIAPTGGFTGRVADRRGEPVGRIEVYAAYFSYDVFGERHLQPAATVSGPHNSVTNERGEFRISGLEPGEYYVIAQAPLSVPCPISGEAFAGAVYFPNATDLDKAETLVVEAGKNYRLPAITLGSAPAGPFHIRMFDPGGKTHSTASKFVMLHREGAEGQDFALAMKAESFGGADVIELGPRAPGNYEIELGWLGASGAPQILTRTTIEVNTAGASLDLPVPSGPNLAGRVLLDQQGSESPSVSGVQIALLPKNGGVPIRTVSDSAGWFASEGVPPGTYAIAFPGLTPDIYVAAVDQGSGAAPSDQVVVASADIQLTVHVSRSGGTVEGHVSDPRNRKAPGVSVVLAPDSPLRGNGFLYRTAVTDQDGAFELKGVAPGAYHVFAWTELEGAAYRNAEFLAKFERYGKAVAVKKGEKQSVDLRVADDAKPPK